MQGRDSESQYRNKERGSHEQSKRQLLSVAFHRFVSRWVLLLTECVPTEAHACWNSGMMAKKAGEVNMEEGQIRWPVGQ